MPKDRKIDMVILGLLAHEDLTGYDIKKLIDSEIRFFWKGSFGSIYPALAEMQRLEQVERLGAEDSGADPAAADSKREKIPYHITDKGRAALREWLSESKASNELRYETLLKLFFGGCADRKVSIRNIEAFESDIRPELELLRFYKGNLEQHLDEEDHVYYYLTVLFGIETYDGYLRWCKKAKKALVN